MNDMHGIIFAYSTSVRLKELTEHRAISSMPFGGRYRLIDFMLSNMVNADITDVGIIMQENYQSMLDHVGSGKDWDLSRKRGGLRLLPPFGYAGARREGFYRGEMEALAGVASYLSHIRQEYVVLADGDLVANLPLEEILGVHIRSGADITAVCSARPIEQPENATYLVPGRRNRVVDVLIGRAEEDAFEALGVYILERKLLDSFISHCVSHNVYDFKRDILQKMKDKLDITAYVFDGYAARLQSASAYFKHNMELLLPEVRSQLFLRERPIRTKVRDEASTYYGPNAHVTNSLIADGCYIEGEVENSVIFRGVRIDPGVKVQNSILMQDTRVCAGAVLNYAISDKEVLINRGRMLMGHETYPIAIAKGSIV